MTDRQRFRIQKFVIVVYLAVRCVSDNLSVSAVSEFELFGVELLIQRFVDTHTRKSACHVELRVKDEGFRLVAFRWLFAEILRLDLGVVVVEVQQIASVRMYDVLLVDVRLIQWFCTAIDAGDANYGEDQNQSVS